MGQTNVVTKEQVKGAFNTIVAVTEAIREAREIPEGTLYAALMGHGCDLATFEKMVRIIVNTGLVEKRGKLLRWIGPEVRA